jgi:hypothetical protein
MDSLTQPIRRIVAEIDQIGGDSRFIGDYTTTTSFVVIQEEARLRGEDEWSGGLSSEWR